MDPETWPCGPAQPHPILGNVQFGFCTLCQEMVLTKQPWVPISLRRVQLSPGQSDLLVFSAKEDTQNGVPSFPRQVAQTSQLLAEVRA